MASIHTLHSFLLSDVHSIQAQVYAPQQSLCFFKIIFLMWTIFKVFIEFCYNAASVLCFSFCASRHTGILASQPGIDPVPSALEAEALTMGHQGGPSIASNNILSLVPWTWRPWFHVYTPIPLVNPAMCCPQDSTQQW